MKTDLTQKINWSIVKRAKLANNSCKDHLDKQQRHMGKPDLVVDQDQQYKITLKIERKADPTAKGYKFICPIFRLDKTKPRLLSLIREGLLYEGDLLIQGCK